MVTMPGEPIESWSPEGEAQTKAITAREPVPYTPPPQIAPEANPLDKYDADTRKAQRFETAEPDWKDRFIANFQAMQRYGTAGVDQLKDIQDAAQDRDLLISGDGTVRQQTAEDAERDAAYLREKRREEIARYENMPWSSSPSEWMGAIGGTVAGAGADPINAIGGSLVKIGTAGWRMAYPVLSRMLETGASNAAMNAAVNGVIQAEEFGADVRDEVDWLSLAADAGLGFVMGAPFGLGAKAPQVEAPPVGEAPWAPRVNRETMPPQGMGPATAEGVQAEFTPAEIGQAQEALFGEVVGTRNLTPEQLTQVDDYLNAGKAGDIPQAEPETEGGLTNDVPAPPVYPLGRGLGTIDDLSKLADDLMQMAGDARALNDEFLRQRGLDWPSVGKLSQPEKEKLANDYQTWFRAREAMRAADETVPPVREGAPAQDQPVSDVPVAGQQEGPAPAPLPIDRTERQFTPSELKVDAKRFQFKEGGDEAGVTERLKGVKKWDPIKSGVTLVWEDLKGDFYIADGHQRHGLASRLEKEGQEPKIRAVVLREADGITAEDARAIAAAKNIAEGTGNAIDAAKILRSRPDMGVDLPPTSALVRDAQGLASLSDDAFGMVVNKKVPAGYAAQVGRLAPDPKTHAELLGLLAKEQPDNAIEAESMIRDALEAPAVQSTMEDMFGSAEVTQILFKERAQVLSAAATAIRKDRAAFSTLVREDARLTAAGNKLATQTNAERAALDAETLANLQAQARRKGPIADALATAAKRLNDGESRQVVVRDFVDSIRGKGAATNPDGRGAGAAGRESEARIAARLGGYRNTDQPAFRKWFGDSKVVDENGEPLVVYHGTSTPTFAAFDKKARGGMGGPLGFWFASKGEATDAFSRSRYADQGGAVLPVYLSIKNPMQYRDWAEFTGHVEKLRKGGKSIEDGVKALRRGLGSRGYDGVVIRNSDTDGGVVRDDWIAFEPTQIKSIFNRGTWDATEPNISFSAPRQDGPGLFDASGKTPEQLIRDAHQAASAGSLSAVPITVKVGNVTQQFMAAIGKLPPVSRQINQGMKPPLHLTRIYRGKLISGSDPALLIQNYKLDGRDRLTEVGYPQRAKEDSIQAWRDAGLTVPGESPPPFKYEPGAEGKPQAAIPGTEPVSQRQLAEMRAKAPLRAGKAQKGMDFGLFGDEADQQGFGFRTDAMGTGLPDLVAAGAPIEEIAAHPFIQDAVRRMDAVPRTDKQPGYMSRDWKAKRAYTFPDGEVVGYDNAVSRLTDDAKKFSADGPVKNEGRAVIILGPPAAGKSMHAEGIAKARFAAIVDPDEAKKVIPEFEGGIGANAVHEESAEMASDVMTRLMDENANMVIPKVGGNEAGIRKLILALQGQGYRVDLVGMNVTYDNAFRRMVGRFLKTGRLINPEYVADVGVKPAATYKTLREQGVADGYAEIDGNGAIGEIPRLLDDGGALDGVPGYGRGGDGNLSPQAARAAGAAQDAPASGIDSPEFETWFAGSKISEGGEPLEVYHGGAANIGSFKSDRADNGQGIYFTKSRGLAAEYAAGYERAGKGASGITGAYLSIKNPKVIKDLGFWERLKERLGGGAKAVKAASRDRAKASGHFTPEDIAELKKQGFDGVINEAADEIIAFDAAQVRPSQPRGVAFARRPAQGKLPVNRPQAGTPARQGAKVTAPRLEDIADDLKALTGAPVRQGRLQRAPKGGGKVAGQYDRDQGVIRMREMADFETQTHETAHSLETEWGRDLNTIKRAHAAELEPMAYAGADPRQQLSEGFAEWFRFYVTTPNYARRSAPNFTTAFEDMLRQRAPEQLATLEAIQRDYKAHVSAPSQAVVAADVVSTRKGSAASELIKEAQKNGVRASVAGYMSRAYTTFFDKLNPINKAVEELAKVYEKRTGQALNITSAQDPYRLARLLQDAYSGGHMDAVHGVVRYHGVTPEGASLADGLALALGDQWGSWSDELMADFASYLISRRAVWEYDRYLAGELPNVPGKFTKGDYETTIAELDAAHPEWEQAAQMIYQWQRNMLRKKYDAGFLTQKLYDELVQRPAYVPFMRDLTDLDKEVSREANATLRNSIIKAFKGSKRSIINPIESMMADAYHFNALMRRNDVFKALEDLGRMVGPGGGGIVERIPSSQLSGTKVNVDEVLKIAGKEAGLNPQDIDSLTTLVDDLMGEDAQATVFRPGEINEKGEPIIYAWRNGKKQALRLADGEFGREMYDALTGMNKESRDLFVSVLALPSTALRYSITTAPPFILANYIRDQVSAWVLAGDRFIPFISGAKGLRDEVMQREITQIYNTFGGIMGGGNVASLDKGRAKRDISALQKKGYSVKRFASIRGFAEFTELTETGTRLAIFDNSFKRAKRDGLNDYEAAVEAAYQARDYIDFGRHGSRMHAARRLVTFLNASLQGLDKTVRTLGAEGAIRKAITPFVNKRAGRPLSARDKANLATSATAWAKVTAIGLFGLGLTALYKDDPEYEEISEYLRATHWMVKTGPGKWFAIPKPFELGFISNLFERGYEAIYKRNPLAMESFTSGLYEVTAPPTEVPIFDVGYQLAHNVDQFGRPIVGPDIAGFEPWRQYTAQTSEIAKAMGYVTNTSPAMIDHAIQGFGASWGKIITDMSRDSAQQRGPIETMTGALSRRFIKDVAAGSVSSRAFWDQMSNTSGPMTQTANTYKNIYENQGETAANAFLETKDENLKAYAMLTTHFEAKEERLHPMRRAKDAISVISTLRKQIAGNDIPLIEGDEDERITLTPDQRKGAQELLARLAMVEARNALITTGIKGHAEKQIMDSETIKQDIATLAPALGEELLARYADKKVYDEATVREVWPDLKNRILEEGVDADFSDLLIGVE